MSEDRLLNALNISKSIRKEDHYADKILRKQELCLIQQKYKTIRETRKENPIEYIMLGNLDCTFDPEKDHYDPKKTVSVLACKYTSICSFRKYTYWCLAPHNYVSIFCKKLALLKAIV